MNQMLKELHEQGFTRGQIEDLLAKIPFVCQVSINFICYSGILTIIRFSFSPSPSQHPSMLEAIKLMKASNTELIILSDANTVYIETILKAYDVSDVFTTVITNPGHFDDAGRLHIRRHVSPDRPHGCTVGCALNICQELTQYLSTREPFEQMIYIGDGRHRHSPSAPQQDPRRVTPN
ncbi:putative phosphatase-domain-containing protein [Endogone sp. FLAS-F59071]|nr:putative phosphatase-domain-containing protein [Endogone sp. FLAS-F59071]|eukprot:RUS23198.1 putative phosphatase-domain-containing protein [Endogone sp. FLAS-F59071]